MLRIATSPSRRGLGSRVMLHLYAKGSPIREAGERETERLNINLWRYGIMKRGLKGFAFLVSGLVLGIIGATASVTAIALSAVGMAKVRRASKN